MNLKPTCQNCNKTKFFWEINRKNLCKECNSKQQDAYYEKMSKEELLIELKLQRTHPEDELPYGFIFFIGFLITFIYGEFIENTYIFSTDFWKNSKLVINQLFNACCYVFLSFIASGIFLILYIAVTHKFESKIAKVLSTFILIITMFLFYVSYVTK